MEWLIRGKEANKIYDVLNNVEETHELPYIDLTTADSDRLPAYAVSQLMLSLENVETVLLCPPSPPVDVEIKAKVEFKDVEELIKYVVNKVSENKVIAVFDEWERDYVILK